MYVRSLARCISWSARGGKSGSNFCKTKGKLTCDYHGVFNLNKIIKVFKNILCIKYTFYKNELSLVD